MAGPRCSYRSARHIAAVVATASLVVAVLGTAPALAAPANRVWVSGHGVDQPGCGAPTAACRSLQYAHDNAVAAGGEIDILDPAGYGAVTITKALSIVNDGVGTAGVQASSGNAISINAGAMDTIYLRGLNIDGLQATGVSGVSFNSGGGLTVVNCVIRHFSSTGIAINLSPGTINFFISDTILSDDGFAGLITGGGTVGFSATVNGIVNRVVAGGEHYGIVLSGINNSGSTDFSLLNSLSYGNINAGLYARGDDKTFISVQNSTFDFNSDGLYLDGTASASLWNSSLENNSDFGVNDQSTGSGGVLSGDNNRMTFNTNGPANLSSLKQELLK
jgi:hypothetical protein